MEVSILRFLLELVPSLLIGFWAGRRHETLSTRLAAPLVRFGVPISVMGLLLKGGLSGDMLQAAGLAVFAMGLVLLGAARLPGLAELASPTLRLGSCTGNTAYFGVPLALAFLPDEALPISIGYDLGATLLVWSLGPLLIGGQVDGPQRLRGLLSSVAGSPATRGLIGALLVQATPWSASVADALWWPSRCVIVLALMVVGHAPGQHSSPGHCAGSTSPAAAEATGGQAAALPVAALASGVSAAVQAFDGSGGCSARRRAHGNLSFAHCRISGC